MTAKSRAASTHAPDFPDSLRFANDGEDVLRGEGETRSEALILEDGKYCGRWRENVGLERGRERDLDGLGRRCRRRGWVWN